MPTSPSWAGKATKVASVSSTARSGVITLQWKMSFLAIESASRSAFRQLLGLGLRLLDRPDVHERLVREVVPLAVAQLVEGADRVLARGVVAGEAGELLGHVERLREEALDLARPAHDDLVFLGQLVDAQDRDDVLEVLVAL